MNKKEKKDWSTRVAEQLSRKFDSARALEHLMEATNGDLYLVGGTTRRILFGDATSGDIDFMVPNDDVRAFVSLDTVGVPWVLNSQKHRRYKWNTLQIDIFSPKEFYKGFETINAALQFFDLKINAIAIHLKQDEVLNPFNISTTAIPLDPGVNWLRWLDKSMTDYDIATLAIRLVRIMYETPLLRIPKKDLEQIESNIIPRIKSTDWNLVSERYPLGKKTFLNDFQKIVFRDV